MGGPCRLLPLALGANKGECASASVQQLPFDLQACPILLCNALEQAPTCLTSPFFCPWQVLTGQSLATFTLADCVHSLLGETLEVLPGHQLARLQAEINSSSSSSSGSGGSSSSALAGEEGSAQQAAAAAALRLAQYSLRRVAAVASLVERLATIPETYEISRATGLTIDQVGVDRR